MLLTALTLHAGKASALVVSPGSVVGVDVLVLEFTDTNANAVFDPFSDLIEKIAGLGSDFGLTSSIAEGDFLVAIVENNSLLVAGPYYPILNLPQSFNIDDPTQFVGARSSIFDNRAAVPVPGAGLLFSLSGISLLSARQLNKSSRSLPLN